VEQRDTQLGECPPAIGVLGIPALVPIHACLFEVVGWIEQRYTHHQTPVLDILQYQTGTNYDQQEKCKTAHVGVAQGGRITFTDPGEQRHHRDTEH